LPVGRLVQLRPGPRRILLCSTAILIIVAELPPPPRDPSCLLALPIVRGLVVGTFIPSAIGFILRELPPRWWSWGLAAYAFRFAFSQNISSSIEAFYDENGLWEWIFWQNIPLTLLMMGLICLGMRREPPDLAELRRSDWSGILFAGVGLALLSAGVDQGNRLDWLNSGTIIGLLLAGGLLLAAFVNELVVERSSTRGAARSQRLPPPFMIATFVFGSTATASSRPTISAGAGLLDSPDRRRAQPVAPASDRARAIAGLALRYIDARLVLAVGLATQAVGSWMDTGLTHDWAGDDFLPSQLVEAVGLALAITSVVIFSVANITPARAITIAGLIQIGRLLGSEIGSACIQSFARTQASVTSNMTGLHLQTGADLS
jgi:DHA2 family multidrug resistance protein